MSWPWETRTSTCRNFATISSGLYRFLAIAVLLDVETYLKSDHFVGGGSRRVGFKPDFPLGWSEHHDPSFRRHMHGDLFHRHYFARALVGLHSGMTVCCEGKLPLFEVLCGRFKHWLLLPVTTSACDPNAMQRILTCIPGIDALRRARPPLISP